MPSKPGPLRDTHSEGKVKPLACNGVAEIANIQGYNCTCMCSQEERALLATVP
jgi:hypothetical protein